MAFVSSVARARELSLQEWGFLLRAFVTITQIDLALRIVGFPRLVARAQAQPPAEPDSLAVEDLWRARRYARWIDSAARHHFIRAQCLHRSLALHTWLRQEGLPSELRIGVRKTGGTLAAHAWVEVGGYVINDRRDWVAAFEPLATLDGERPNWTRLALVSGQLQAQNQ